MHGGGDHDQSWGWWYGMKSTGTYALYFCLSSELYFFDSPLLSPLQAEFPSICSSCYSTQLRSLCLSYTLKQLQYLQGMKLQVSVTYIHLSYLRERRHYRVFSTTSDQMDRKYQEQATMSLLVLPKPIQIVRAIISHPHARVSDSPDCSPAIKSKIFLNWFKSLKSFQTLKSSQFLQSFQFSKGFRSCKGFDCWTAMQTIRHPASR